ncbi:hypothetical protein CEXT_80021 [Caerostris extrusa]|uniref:Uncharacterized protein n=1 Tax=Caerostris extrusa TaxID=172846 RepID=A0AAV4T184_CAEEX|nr:hypothetical protein CEXT_80021 [Caerostris extrusa]
MRSSISPWVAWIYLRGGTGCDEEAINADGYWKQSIDFYSSLVVLPQEAIAVVYDITCLLQLMRWLFFNFAMNPPSLYDLSLRQIVEILRVGIWRRFEENPLELIPKSIYDDLVKLTFSLPIYARPHLFDDEYLANLSADEKHFQRVCHVDCMSLIRMMIGRMWPSVRSLSTPIHLQYNEAASRILIDRCPNLEDLHTEALFSTDFFENLQKPTKSEISLEQ